MTHNVTKHTRLSGIVGVALGYETDCKLSKTMPILVFLLFILRRINKTMVPKSIRSLFLSPNFSKNTNHLKQTYMRLNLKFFHSLYATLNDGLLYLCLLKNEHNIPYL